MIGPSLLNLSHRTQVGIWSMGALLSAFSLGQAIAAVVSGRIIDRSDSMVQFAVSYCITAVGCIMLPLAREFSLVLISGVCFGCTMGVLDTAGNVLLLRIHGESSATWLQAAHCLFGVGSLVAPLVMRACGLSIADERIVPSWGGMMFINAMLFVSLALVVTRLHVWGASDPVRRQTGSGAPLASANTCDKDLSAPPSNGTGSLTVVVLGAAFLAFEVGGLEMGFGGFQFTYMVTHQHAAAGQAAAVNGAFWGAYTLSRALASAASALQLPTSRLLHGCCALAVLSLAVFIAYPDSPDVFWVVALACGAAMAPMYALVVSLCQELAFIDGFRMLLLVTGASIGKLVIPAVIAAAFDMTGPFAFPIATFGCACACLLLSLAMSLVAVQQDQEEASDYLAIQKC